MRAYPDDEPDMDLLERVTRRLPVEEAAVIDALPREDFLTWIDTYLALRRTGTVLDDGLNAEFMARLFVEAGIELVVPEEPARLPVDVRRYQAPLAFAAPLASAASH